MAELGWFAAGVCAAAFLILWFGVSYRELSDKRRSLDSAREQLELHQKLFMQERGGELDEAAGKQLEAKRMVCREVEKNYNALLKNPLYAIPGALMGFHRAGEE